MRSGGLGSTMLVRAWAFGLCLLLPACNLFNEKPATPEVVVKTVPDTPPENADMVPPPQNTEAQDEASGTSVAPIPPATPQPKPEIVAMNAQSLIGLLPQEVLAQLGPPDVLSDNSPMQTWRYLAGPCTLTLQFFKELETDVFRALQYEVIGGDEASCLYRLERRKGV